ncbi:MAG TPA: NAD(P)H-binding protein [Patescibacteria group bacterium]
MKQNIKVAVIGGTGKAGSYLVKELLSQKFNLKVLLRHPEQDSLSRGFGSLQLLSHPSVEIVTGDISDYETVRSLLAGCTVVISALGQKKEEPLISSLATSHIIRAMNEYAIRRYISITGLSLDLPGDKRSLLVREASAFMKHTFPVVMADKQKAFTILSGSNIDWTLVRLPFIIQTDDRGKWAIDLIDCPGDRIRTTDLANFLIKQISDRKFIRKAPFIASV